VVLRLLLLKHIRNWGYDTLEREVRAYLVYRAFTRIGDEKVPDAKTLARLGQLLGAEVIEELHQRIVQLAQECGETGERYHGGGTNIHYPTDTVCWGTAREY
jgi:IS5 family transposase